MKLKITKITKNFVHVELPKKSVPPGAKYMSFEIVGFENGRN